MAVFEEFCWVLNKLKAQTAFYSHGDETTTLPGDVEAKESAVEFQLEHELCSKNGLLRKAFDSKKSVLDWVEHVELFSRERKKGNERFLSRIGLSILRNCCMGKKEESIAWIRTAYVLMSRE